METDRKERSNPDNPVNRFKVYIIIGILLSITFAIGNYYWSLFSDSKRVQGEITMYKLNDNYEYSIVVKYYDNKYNKYIHFTPENYSSEEKPKVSSNIEVVLPKKGTPMVYVDFSSYKLYIYRFLDFAGFNLLISGWILMVLLLPTTKKKK